MHILYYINDSNVDCSNKKRLECQNMTREFYHYTEIKKVTAGIEVSDKKKFYSIKC